MPMQVLRKRELHTRYLVEHTRVERRLLATLHHPFLVPLRFAFQTKEKLYLVTDYCQVSHMDGSISISHFPSIQIER